MTQSHTRLARRAVRIAFPLFCMRMRIFGREAPADRIWPSYGSALSRRLYRQSHTDRPAPVTAPRVGYTRRGKQGDLAIRLQRRVARVLRARITKYVWPGGYLLVYYTRSGSTLCPNCAAVSRLEHDDPIIGRETIDYATDGYCDPEDVPANIADQDRAGIYPLICDGCNADLRAL